MQSFVCRRKLLIFKQARKHDNDDDDDDDYEDEDYLWKHVVMPRLSNSRQFWRESFAW